jgi:hypothetical protein
MSERASTIWTAFAALSEPRYALNTTALRSERRKSHGFSKATRDPCARHPARKVFADVDGAVAVLVRTAGREPRIATKPDPSRPGR